jgi:dipeptidyl aminopeptidase/acylaminoacyl peptidase
MDELRRAADLLVADPPAPVASLEELSRRNARRRNRRRVIVIAVALVVGAGSVVAVSRPSTDEANVVTQPEASRGRLAIATANGVTLIDEREGVIAELDLGFAPIHVSWSPDGQRLVAADGTDLWLIDRDGLRPRRLEDSGWDISWRGDHELVFTRGETVPGYRRWSRDGRLAEVGAEASIVVNRPNGTVERRLGPLPEAEPGGIVIHSWSPDAHWIVYSAYPTASDSIAQDGVPLYAVRVADGYAFRIGVTLDYDGWIQWSPDGETVLVVDGEGRFLTERKVLRSCDLGAVRCVDLPAPPDVSTFDPAWSPDGGRLAFLQVSTRESASGPLGELWVSEADGDDARKVAGVAPGVLRPMWTDDGAAILVLNSVGGGGATAVERVPVSGGTPLRLASVTVSHAQGFAGHVTPVIAWSASSR